MCDKAGYPHRVEQRTIGDDLLRVSLALSSGCIIFLLCLFGPMIG